MFGGNDLFWCFMNETIADSVKIAQFRLNKLPVPFFISDGGLKRIG
jgi:hypothetical protein